MQPRTRPQPPTPAALLALLALIALGGCAPLTAVGGSAPAEDPFVVADLFATQGKALATIAISPTAAVTDAVHDLPTSTPPATAPMPTAVLLRPTMPIATPGPTPVRPIDVPLPATDTPVPAACPAPPAPFGAAWARSPEAQALLGCPVGTPQTMRGAWQTYERGVMVWREQDRSIFVISHLASQQGQSTASWWRLDDTYQEGEALDNMGLSAPPGMLMPERGFGKVWRSNAFVRDALGWATGGEAGMDSVWLQFERGWMMTGPGGRPVYALVPLDGPPYTTGYHLGAMLP